MCSFDIYGTRYETLKHALAIAWRKAAGGKATHYKIEKLLTYERFVWFPPQANAPANLEPNLTLKESEKLDLKLHVYCDTSMKKSHKGTPTLILYWGHEDHVREDDPKQLPFTLDIDRAAHFVQA